MSFIIKMIYFVCLIASFGQSASSAVERIDFRSEDFSDDEIETDRYCANAALARAGITERITNETSNEGAFGTLFYTSNYAVKLSTAEYFFGLNNAESARLINVKNQIQADAPAGVKFCLPEHVYKVYVDGENCWSDDNDGYNIQIMPRIHAQATMGDIAMNCIRNRSAENMALMRCFGEKMGLFQSSGLVQNPDGTPDRTCMHGDLNPENVLVTNRRVSGTRADFTFVDNAEYSMPQEIPGAIECVLGGGSLVSDITRFTYFCLYNAMENVSGILNDGIYLMLQNFFRGYIPQLPREVCQKLMTNLYGNPQECLAQTNRDNKHPIGGENRHLDNTILGIQFRAFQTAYRAVYPPEVLPRSSVAASLVRVPVAGRFGYTPTRFPDSNRPRCTPVRLPVATTPQNAPVYVPFVNAPLPVVNRAVVLPVLNKAQQKQLVRQQRAERRAAVRAQKAQKKQLVREQKAQKAEQRRAEKARKIIQRAALKAQKTAQKLAVKVQKDLQKAAAKLNKQR